MISLAIFLHQTLYKTISNLVRLEFKQVELAYVKNNRKFSNKNNVSFQNSCEQYDSSLIDKNT